MYLLSQWKREGGGEGIYLCFVLAADLPFRKEKEKKEYMLVPKFKDIEKLYY